jgi:hypothetical protein
LGIILRADLGVTHWRGEKRLASFCRLRFGFQSGILTQLGNCLAEEGAIYDTHRVLISPEEKGTVRWFQTHS